MTDRALDVNDDRRLRRSLRLAAGFVAMLWLIRLDTAVFDLDLDFLGVYPRRLSGLLGIVFAPLIHASLRTFSPIRSRCS